LQASALSQGSIRAAWTWALVFLNDMKTLTLFFGVTHLFFAVGLGQGGVAIVKADPGACEQNSAYFDGLRNELTKDPTAKVTAKFYAGKTENNVVSEKRANYVQKFLAQSKGFDTSRLQFINSGKLNTNENPKIEFYIVRPGETDGKLYLVSYAQVNKTPCMDCCPGVFQYIGPKIKKKAKKP
jgi:hypothetical protein